MSTEQIRLEQMYAEAQKELGIEPKTEAVGQVVPTSEEVVTESSVVEEKKPERVFTALELEQMEKGWDPYKEGGVDAAEFKRVGEIIEAKRAASKAAKAARSEVAELTDTVKQLVEHNKKLALAAIEKQQKELALAKMEKIRDGDVDGVISIEQEQARLQAERQAQDSIKAPEAVATEELSPEVISFRQKYDSYLTGTSEEAIAVQAVVKSKIEYYMKNNPNVDEKVAIRDIEETLSKVFPDKFEVKQPSKVAKVSVGSQSKPSGNDFAANMSFEDKALYESVRAVDPTFSLEDFHKMYLKSKK